MRYEDKRKQEMWDWFHANFIPPTECVPRMSEEHGYQYVCGGPFYADDVLNNQFGSLYPENIIREVIEDLDVESPEWARSEHYEYR